MYPIEQQEILHESFKIFDSLDNINRYFQDKIGEIDEYLDKEL